MRSFAIRLSLLLAVAAAQQTLFNFDYNNYNVDGVTEYSMNNWDKVTCNNEDTCVRSFHSRSIHSQLRHTSPRTFYSSDTRTSTRTPSDGNSGPTTASGVPETHPTETVESIDSHPST